MIRVQVLSAAKHLQWPWEGNPQFVLPAPKGFWNRTVRVDPFPCYAHAVPLVEQTAKAVAKAWPLPVVATINVLDRDTPERTNGHCEISYDYDGPAPHRWTASIVLWGKRIPPHPAMTRYLVAHEYGHAVAKHVSLLLTTEAKDDATSDALYKDYAKLRNMKAPRYYGGLTWHASVGELFANDFRILKCGVETEFWPHEGFKRPEDVPAVRKFWEEL